MKRPNFNKDDIIAGLTGAIAGTPQAMGFALIAGVNPIYGLYTAIVSTILGALFGNSTFMTVGPTNALSLVVFGAIGQLSGDNQLASMVVLTFLVGVFYLIFGFFRLGVFIRFVSNAVMTGFIAGAGLLIIFGQVANLNGYTPSGDSSLLRFWDWLFHLHHSHPQTLLISAVTLIIILLIQRTQWKNYALLVSFLIASLTVAIFGLNNVALVSDISEIPRGLLQFSIPNLELMPQLVSVAFAIAILGAVQSAAITNSIKEVKGKSIDVNRDFIGMGIANIAGGFTQSMPACGSLSRTAVNITAGANTQAANVFAGGFVGLFLLFLGPWIEWVTLPSLSVQLILAAISLIKLSEIQFVWRIHYTARIAMITTFLSALLLPLEYSIYLGVGISLILYLIQSSNAITAMQLIPLDDGRYKSVPMPESLTNQDITIISVHGNLYFAAVSKLKKILPDPETCSGTIVIIRLRENSVLASTGIHFLEKYGRTLKSNGGDLMLVGLSAETRKNILYSSNHDFDEKHLYLATDILFEATTQAYHDAKQKIAMA